MYKLTKKKYGYHLLLDGFVRLDDIEKWHEESKMLLNQADAPKEFGVFVDMRTLKPLSAECSARMEEVQKLYKMKGMSRSVLILANPIITMQFKRIAKSTNIYQWERYIDASVVKDWENAGIRWIEAEVDPDL